MASYSQTVKQTAIAAIAAAAGLYKASPGTYPQFAPLPGVNILLARTWPTTDAALTALLIYIFDDDSTSKGEGAELQFQRISTLVIEARVATADDKVTDQNLDDLCEAVKEALLTNAAFISQFDGQRVRRVKVASKLNAQGQLVVGNAVMAFELQISEDFEPIVTQALAGANLYLDAVNVFDPTGTYAPPFSYPVTPGSPSSPRTAGPDGRPEIAAKIDLNS